MMKKTLVYIDIENLSIEEIRTWLYEIKTREDLQLYAVKAYANRVMIGTRANLFCDLNVKLIDTTRASSNKKNSADMRIAVDCIYDVMCPTMGKPDLVIILTHDHDFECVVNRLESMGIKVETKIEQNSEKKSIGDLNNFMKVFGYLPPTQEKALVPLKGYVTSCIGRNFTEQDVDAFVGYRKKALAYKLAKMDKALNGAIEAIPNDEFGYQSFRDVAAPVLNLKERELRSVFTRAVFGIEAKF